MTQLSEHFTLEELSHSDIAVRLGIDNTPPIDLYDNLRRLCVLLESVRKTIGRIDGREIRPSQLLGRERVA